tara:strand:- start:412 stop:576 length:165 start_codon:yes stop_codon:yes gene_type:complete
MSRFGDLVRGESTPEPAPAPVVEETPTPKKAKTSDESWVSNKAPSKKKKKTWDL